MTAGDLPDWAERGSSGGPTTLQRLAPSFALTAVAGVAAFLGHVTASAIAVLLAIGVAQASVLSDRVAVGIARLAARIGHAVAAVVTVVLLLPLYALVFVPAALVMRALHIDALASWAIDRTTWRARREGPRARPHRLFAAERAWSDMPSGGQDRRWQIARVVVAVLAIEALAVGVFVVVRDRRDPEPVFEGVSGSSAAQSAALRDLPWVPAAMAEIGELTLGSVYTPATGGSLRDYHGEYVNVENRVRRSYATQLPGEPIDVFFFGGSTMFGFDLQRDLHTIPSEVVRLAETDGVPIRAWNYGGPGYTNYQENQILALLLTSGIVPDVAVFLDGINDQALQITNSLLHADLPGEPSQLQAQLIRDALATTDVLPGDPLPPSPIDPEDEGIRPAGQVHADDVVNDVIEVYGQGVGLGRLLGEAYGFPVLHYWQPTLMSREPLDPGEVELFPGNGFDDFRYEAMRALFARVADRLPEGIIDITDAMNGVDGPVFSDITHANEAGAAAIAAAMYPTLAETIEERVASG